MGFEAWLSLPTVGQPGVYPECGGQEQGKEGILRLCNAHGRKRRTSYYEYKIHFSTQFARVADDKIGIRAADESLLALGDSPSDFSPWYITVTVALIGEQKIKAAQ